jgi:pilus assembly protein CpaE
MRAIIGYGSGVDSQGLRQTVLGAGLDCGAEDAVPVAELEARLGQGNADLVVAALGSQPENDLRALERLSDISKAPIVAVGPVGDASLVMRAMRAGALQFLDVADLRRELDASLEKLIASRALPNERGVVVAVFAPTPGSGGTTVAANLAAALTKQHGKGVGLIELACQHSDLALLLDIKPECTLADVCQRWEKLDKVGLGRSMHEHKSGVHVLANKDLLETDIPERDAVRRVTVLARALFRATVLELDRSLDDSQLEAMKLSDRVLVVVRPDVPCVRRAQQALHAAAQAGVSKQRFALVVNRWGIPGRLRQAKIEEALGMKALQLIPDDPKRATTAANQGVLLLDVSRMAAISRAFAELAKRICQ